MKRSWPTLEQAQADLTYKELYALANETINDLLDDLLERKDRSLIMIIDGVTWSYLGGQWLKVTVTPTTIEFATPVPERVGDDRTP